MASLIFYDKAVALDRKQHQQLKLRHVANHYAFAAKTNSVLLAHTEFAEAARDYPIVFVKQGDGPFAAAALLGLRGDVNLMVGARGDWEAGTYVPAFVRRYPFVLATGEDAQTLTVCVDEGCAGLNRTRGEKLFQADGSETPYLQGIVEFLRLFHTEMQQTGALLAKLDALGLLSPKVISVEHDGQASHLDGLWMVDEQKLLTLEDAATLELVRSGAMGLIYAHFLSLKNVVRLAQRQGARQRVAAKTATPRSGDSAVVH